MVPEDGAVGVADEDDGVLPPIAHLSPQGQLLLVTATAASPFAKRVPPNRLQASGMATRGIIMMMVMVLVVMMMVMDGE